MFVGRRAIERMGYPARLVSLAFVVVVAGCGTTVAPSSGSSEVSHVPTPSGTLAAVASSAPTVPPGPTVLPTSHPGGLAPGSLAVTVSDRLVVRSKPRVSADSVQYKPLLPTGTELLVVDGPVEASGYTWYRVAPTSVTLDGGPVDGWVAIAARDGTPWVALAEGALAGLEIATSNVARAPAIPATAVTAATALNAFGLDLYRRLLAEPDLGLKGKNVVISPTSIALALAMARAGAKGETARQMDAVLHTSGWKDLGSGLNALDQALASRNATWKDDQGLTHALSLKVANAAFAQRDWPIEPSYLDGIAQTFGAGLGLVDYIAAREAARTAINAWVNRQTAKRIPELLAPTDLDEMTRLILVNAVYLKANWLDEFPLEGTRSRAFTRLDGSRVTVPTMTVQGDQDVPYAKGTGWKATELLYAGGQRYGETSASSLAMALILPDDLTRFEASLSAATVRSIATTLAAERKKLSKLTADPSPTSEGCESYAYGLRVYLPRFGIETRADLVPTLKRLGMSQATTTSADFSGITSADRLFIQKVIHQANIDVDEKGTEAAAATAVEMGSTGGCGPAGPRRILILRLDRPFLFLIRDIKTGAILFMGRVLDPSVKR